MVTLPPCSALTIVLSSPDASHYHEWMKLKKKPTVHMPSWSVDEATAVVPAVYPQRLMADGVTTIYPGRFKLYGGIARTVFSPDDDGRLEKELNTAVASCNLDTLYRSIETGERLGPLQQLLQYEVGSNADGTPDFRSATMDFASDEICERVMKEKEERGANEVVSFLASSAGKPDVAGMRGKVFERYAHGVLTAGGVFRARWEGDATHTDIYLKFPPSTQKGVVGDLTVLKKGEYARLLKSNFKTIDAARFPKHLFQMTVSPTHSINLLGLNAAMMDLGLIGKPGGAQQCALYFAVPPDIHPVYQHKPGSMVPADSTLPANISLMVLEIPLPELKAQTIGTAASSAATSTSALAPAAAGGKRKQRVEDADSLLPPAKKNVAVTKCDCTAGCKTGHCTCKKHGNKCGPRCHTTASPASAAACSNL